MFPRSLLLAAACLVVAAFTAGPAAAQTTETPAPGASPGACTDTARPTSGFTRRQARRAARGRRHILRGSASDVGCGLDRVRISVALKRGARCRHLTRRGKLTHRTRCGARRWLAVRGSSHWSFRLPKRLPHGSYLIRTRAIDFSGNRQFERPHRLRLR
jgi:hypothetical protein